MIENSLERVLRLARAYQRQERGREENVRGYISKPKWAAGQKEWEAKGEGAAAKDRAADEAAEVPAGFSKAGTTSDGRDVLLKGGEVHIAGTGKIGTVSQFTRSTQVSGSTRIAVGRIADQRWKAVLSQGGQTVHDTAHNRQVAIDALVRAYEMMAKRARLSGAGQASIG